VGSVSLFEACRVTRGGEWWDRGAPPLPSYASLETEWLQAAPHLVSPLFCARARTMTPPDQRVETPLGFERFWGGDCFLLCLGEKNLRERPAKCGIQIFPDPTGFSIARTLLNVDASVPPTPCVRGDK